MARPTSGDVANTCGCPGAEPPGGATSAPDSRCPRWRAPGPGRSRRPRPAAGHLEPHPPTSPLLRRRLRRPRTPGRPWPARRCGTGRSAHAGTDTVTRTGRAPGGVRTGADGRPSSSARRAPARTSRAAAGRSAARPPAGRRVRRDPRGQLRRRPGHRPGRRRRQGPGRCPRLLGRARHRAALQAGGDHRAGAGRRAVPQHLAVAGRQAVARCQPAAHPTSPGRSASATRPGPGVDRLAVRVDERGRPAPGPPRPPVPDSARSGPRPTARRGEATRTGTTSPRTTAATSSASSTLRAGGAPAQQVLEELLVVAAGEDGLEQLLAQRLDERRVLRVGVARCRALVHPQVQQVQHAAHRAVVVVQRQLQRQDLLAEHPLADGDRLVGVRAGAVELGQDDQPGQVLQGLPERHRPGVDPLHRGQHEDRRPGRPQARRPLAGQVRRAGHVEQRRGPTPPSRAHDTPRRPGGPWGTPRGR